MALVMEKAFALFVYSQRTGTVWFPVFARVIRAPPKLRGKSAYR